ncbi:caspase recruitment domain-containing protein 19 isoform X3 [Accipiter gentilis]|uniref:caspase recruitment domain-containing protein 19 isoform X3 n=1 Tax=Astur gentilis TaxID=8957 RepID=UPI00210F464C|nr:caspase recruitment domain-containing protein 19 isoform X3 [Accipiter gentilis]
MFQPLGLVGLFLFVFFKFSSWSTVLHWWVVLVGSFTSLVYQKPEGSSLCALGRDFSELEFRNPKASLHTRLSDLIKHLQKKGDRHCQEFYRALQINAEELYNDLPSRKILKTTDSTEIDTDKEKYMLNDRGPVFFLACFSVAAGFALFWYCCNSDTKVVGRARRILGFSPIIIGRHVRNICMLYLEDISRN